MLSQKDHKLNRDHIIVMVDSADRDTVLYPNSAVYMYPLVTPIRNAASIEIMGFQMICSETVINAGNSTFSVTLGGSTVTATMPITDAKDLTTLAQLLQDALTTVNAGFTVNASPSTNRLAITYAAAFSLSVNASFARVFGFRGGDERGAGTCTAVLVGSTWTLSGSKMAEPFGEPYVLLHLNDYERNTGVTVQAQRSFLMIPLESKPLNTRFLMASDQKERKGVFRLTGNQCKVDWLKIRFTRPDGSLYDFNGTDHQIIFRIIKADQQDYVN